MQMAGKKIASSIFTAAEERVTMWLKSHSCFIFRFPVAKPPVNEVPTNIDFYKTAIVGFPSGDKRMTFMQMEALTGWREYCTF